MKNKAHFFPEIGVGIDIESIDRFKGLTRVDDRTFLHRIYTAKELSYCFAKKYPAQHLAARFAGKEAVLKALGELGTARQHLNTIEISNGKRGAPQVSLLNKCGHFCVKISLSHDKDKALACALAWRTIAAD